MQIERQWLKDIRGGLAPYKMDLTHRLHSSPGGGARAHSAGVDGPCAHGGAHGSESVEDGIGHPFASFFFRNLGK
eukprot:CAMPEP_0194305972 /NCGR_PEP_ID=MMETSP0171-20130528/3268_1 /TAXON_ID=218684 /ORGANISM="Corethron pennatum, Strain L29A3" /LENGTH=74 /DNA_ID=CAMNT_0039057641 /DNA_START=254 /DNA_END=475 /DNA_ORIENTATION=-